MASVSETFVLNVPCIRKGEESETEIVVRYSDEWPGKLPILVILSDYSVKHGKYKKHRAFDVEEIQSETGRAWILHRTEEAIRSDGFDNAFYGVEIESPESHRCSCPGHAAARPGHTCVHVRAMLALLAHNKLGPHPLAGRPAEPFPSEQQVHDDAVNPWAADEVVTLTEKGIVATDPVAAH